MDNSAYGDYQEVRFEEYEKICRRCGICCGSLNDPCVHLGREEESGKYYCRIYQNRFGIRETVGGRQFNCVAIRDNIKMGALQPQCAYTATTKKDFCDSGNISTEIF
ncbi:MAG: hypothetical protein JW800_04155 [Candidatus Omnitrophica bacterium]|nr:hypothetical protein [Candidatus Omnitrophota bacterium]